MTATVYIGLGSNLGDCDGTLRQAVDALVATPGVHAVRLSRPIETCPVGGPQRQQPYLNAVAEVMTELPPSAFLALLHEIEDRLGRRRSVANAPRTVDLDVLLYDAQVIETPDLTVPHPRMALRRFVLEPLAQLAPQALHPRLGVSAGDLAANLRRRPLYVAIAGPAAERTAAASQIAGLRNATLVDPRVDPEAGLPFLEALADRLNPVRWTGQGDRWVVSAGAMGQGPAWAESALDNDALQAYHNRFEQLLLRSIRPTFVALVAHPTKDRLGGGDRTRVLYESWGVPVLAVGPGDAEAIVLAIDSATA